MKVVLAAVALAALAGSEASAAVILNFDVATETGGRFIFSLPENPVPDAVFQAAGEPVGEGAIVFRTNVLDGAHNSRLLQVSFSNTPGFLAMRITLPSENIFLGERLLAFRDFSALPLLMLTGTIANPTFKRGTFQYASFPGSQQSIPLDGGTVRISAITAAVPEPAAWLSMIGGFGLMGDALRYRRRHALSNA